MRGREAHWRSIGKRRVCQDVRNLVVQHDLILQVNREAHPGDTGNGESHSDLAGFEYPCDGPNKPLCKEPLVLQVAYPNNPDAAQVHHAQLALQKVGIIWPRAA